MEKGDYVLATKYADGDPCDQWCVGWYDHHYDHFGQTRHMVVDSDGRQFRGNGFRRVGLITPDVGEWLLRNSKDLERSPFHINLWRLIGHETEVNQEDDLPESEPEMPVDAITLRMTGYVYEVDDGVVCLILHQRRRFIEIVDDHQWEFSVADAKKYGMTDSELVAGQYVECLFTPGVGILIKGIHVLWTQEEVDQIHRKAKEVANKLEGIMK